MKVLTAERVCGSSCAYVLISTPSVLRSGTLAAGSDGWKPLSFLTGLPLLSPDQRDDEHRRADREHDHADPEQVALEPR